jgi:sarcosine/dimethylglycine N-methyltransferase
MTDERVQDHYANAGTGSSIAARIAAAVRATGGPNTSITPETLAPFDHFHGGGLATTQELVAALQPQAGETILDIGCGIGGPARWMARRYNCSLTGVDLTQEFCDAARELNSLCGMAEQVRIVEGSALSLPLPDAVFDRAFSQFMVMNVADKAGVYREAFRVLKPGGGSWRVTSVLVRTGYPNFLCLGLRFRITAFWRRTRTRNAISPARGLKSPRCATPR